MVLTPDRVSEFLSDGSEQTAQLGERLGELLQAGDVLCLQGGLGAGKTCMAQGIARGWGIKERVTSPTFTVLNEYMRPHQDSTRFYHLDAYRLNDAEEVWMLGLGDVLSAEGVLVVEWPERIAGALPAERLWIVLESVGVGERHIMLEARGMRYVALLEALDAARN